MGLGAGVEAVVPPSTEMGMCVRAYPHPDNSGSRELRL